jgi:hypothetical protein
VKKIIIILLVIVCFLCLFTSFFLINEFTKRAYFTPLNEANPSNSTQGGEAFDGENLVFDGVVMFPQHALYYRC